MKSTCTVHQQTPYSTPYSTVVCEDAEYSRVHSEYIDDTLEYYVLCKVRRVHSEYTQTTSEYYVLCMEYGVLCSEHGVLCTVRPTHPSPTFHTSVLPSLGPQLPALSCPYFSTQHSALSTQSESSQHSALSEHSAPIKAAAASRGARRPSPNTPSTGRAGAASPSPTRASLPCWSRPCACPSSARRSPSASPPSRCS